MSDTVDTCIDVRYCRYMYWCPILLKHVLMSDSVDTCIDVRYCRNMYWCPILSIHVLMSDTVDTCIDVRYCRYMYWCPILSIHVLMSDTVDTCTIYDSMFQSSCFNVREQMYHTQSYPHNCKLVTRPVRPVYQRFLRSMNRSFTRYTCIFIIMLETAELSCNIF